MFPYKLTKLAALLLPALFVPFIEILLSLILVGSRCEFGRLEKKKKKEKRKKKIVRKKVQNIQNIQNKEKRNK